MKKVLAGIAVLAFVAAAQAELLNTWTFTSGDNAASGNVKNSDAENIGQVTFGNLTRSEGMDKQATSAGQFSANKWTSDRDISFTIDVNSGYEIAAGSILHASAINGTQGAPNTLQWKLDGTSVGSAWTLSTASGSSTISDVSLPIIDASKQHVVALTYTQPGRINSATANATADGNVRLYGPLTLDGKIQEATSPSGVPEPATMSLLGLGALAMVLRRKLSK